jgi:hypothetical protein
MASIVARFTLRAEPDLWPRAAQTPHLPAKLYWMIYIVDVVDMVSVVPGTNGMLSGNL